MTEGKNPPKGGSSVSKNNELERVKKVIDFLIDQKSHELLKLNESPVIRNLNHYTHERKHLIGGQIQGLCDASIIINKAILGEINLLEYKIYKG